MSYLVLARKYRPDSFASVTGQEHVTRTLRNAITRNKIAHAYLFAGPRGVGKTSISRIFAKALNCSEGPTPTPCLKCDNCRAITQGSSLAVREIDGASHNSVDNVRELIESFRSLPPPGSKYKIYIIDEVHMLSTSAFNALLKSLEEPPPNTVFILATTEAHKIPETVISRCQRFDFRALSPEEIYARLVEVAQREKIEICEEALRLVARVADGSMRDAQSLLDRVHAFSDGAITAHDAGVALGSVDRDILRQLSQAVFDQEVETALAIVQQCFTSGVDPTLFLREFAAHWRELLLARFGGSRALEAIGTAGNEAGQLIAQVKDRSATDVHDLVHLARSGADEALRSVYPKYALESLIVRMATREPVQELKQLIDALQQPVVPRTTTATRTEVAKSTPPVPQGTLHWGSFVNFAGERSSKILAEHLKRVSVDQFSTGVLRGHGPAFTVTTINSAQNREKLLAVLAEYSQTQQWQVNFVASEMAGDAIPGSLIESEDRSRKQAAQERKETISSHPRLKSLQKVFPGSTIEAITVKEE